MQNVLIKAAGLYTFPNRLSSVPQGALLVANNVIINRDSILESRRGFNLYGTASGIGLADTEHQLMVYKGTILRHWGAGSGTTLEYDSDGAGTFLPFNIVLTGTLNGTTTVTGITSTSQLAPGMSITGTNIPVNTTIADILNNTSLVLSNAATGSGSVSLTFQQIISEVNEGLRIKSLEQNGNIYFTTANGIKKISISDTSDLDTAIIENAGMIQALDLSATLNNVSPFFQQESVIAYRMVWGKNDANSNLILGAPSSRTVIYNPVTNLLIPNFNGLLSLLDTINTSTGIHAQNYVSTFKVPLNASAFTLQTNLNGLATALDADIASATGGTLTTSGNPTVTGPTNSLYTVQWSTTTNPIGVYTVGSPVVVTGITPVTFNTTGTVTAVTSSTITYTQTTNPGSYISGTGTIKRTTYASITPSVTLSETPTTDQLVGGLNYGNQGLQSFFNQIVADLQDETTTVITTQPGFVSATQSAGVTLQFVIPQGITTVDFYQIYRTAQTLSGTGVALSQLDPGDEEGLVYEANPTNTDLTNGYIKINDITPDSFRGAYLYTNPNTGNGIQSAQNPPPLAQDLTSFKGYTFYANTETFQMLNLSMLSVTQLVSGTSTFTITNGTTSNTYTFVAGVAQIQTVTTVADVSGSLNSKYFTLWSGKNQTEYYVWFNINGAGVDPAVSGATGIKVSAATNTTAANIASATRTAINQISDFTVTGSSTSVIITNTTAGIATAAANGVASPGFSYSVGTIGTGENASTQKVLISSQSTPAQQVDESARSLVRVINSNDSELVYAFYLSGPTNVPGLILLQGRILGAPAFYINVNSSTTTGTQFSPALPASGSTVISSNEVKPARIYYSQFQQPDAVPLLNTLDIGSTDKPIIRLLALRDNLYALKQEGIYRITGLTAPFTVSLFDSSTFLKAPDSAVVLNNLIYGYTSQGVVSVSDGGVTVVSRPIEDQLVKLTTPGYSNFSTATFGITYESDRSYYLYTVTNTSDEYATQVFHYNTFTKSWTGGDGSKRCGVVNYDNDVMYLGPTDTNYVEQERKNFDRTDYADRQLTLTLGANSVNGTSVILPSLVDISVGDVLEQLQYLTILQFNQLLAKLDSDSILTDKNYVSSSTALPGDSLNTDLDSLITKISTDAGRVAVSGHTSATTYTNLSPTPSTSTGMQTTFNSLIALLNSDSGVGGKNYIESNGYVVQETIIEGLGSGNTITTQYAYPFIQGNINVYNHINCETQYAPIYMQDPSMTKQVSEGTLIFEDSSYSTATISYGSDLSGSLFPIPFEGNGNGAFGNIVFGNGTFGGSGSGIPFRTYIPLEKQRCRYIIADFQHAIAREKFSLYGLSLTYNPVSQRGYR